MTGTTYQRFATTLRALGCRAGWIVLPVSPFAVEGAITSPRLDVIWSVPAEGGRRSDAKQFDLDIEGMAEAADGSDRPFRQMCESSERTKATRGSRAVRWLATSENRVRRQRPGSSR